MFQFQTRIENVGDLQVLLHTVSGGSLTAAARALGMTPAAASATLKRLETQLGTRLFERSTRAMRLTPSGQILLEYAQRAFELLAEGESQLDAERGALVGTVRVSAPSDLARTVLMPMLDEFLHLHPGVKLALNVGDRVLDVLRDEVDLAIRYGELSDSRLVARPLSLARPVVSASPDYLSRHGTPHTPTDLVDHNCISFIRGGRTSNSWRFGQNGQWTMVRVSGDRIVDDASLAREWAVSGAGIIFMTEIEQRRDLQSGNLVRLLTEWETDPYPLHALLPSGRFVPNRVRAFLDFIAGRFAELRRSNTEH
ncbi:LysR family transcriptional regulator [Bradyrhizobium sp. CCBAU 45384]|uniref:LysR family transcriptional regulator n=1 Tax=Bradyrhizobium sp. CCBAU 45384 TaxID=858428 RepID=UPI0023056609|nr:LysR family transcriptional regulator [Bradyrhizobium sp. CCBAU 45384]MDA9406173.1 LysR family transcriptional regulator [Bradyrhizobium sp. CCBAU 45384]